MGNNYEIVKRPDGSWFIHFSNHEKFSHCHIESVVEYMCGLSKFLDNEINLGLYKCYDDGLNWKDAAEYVCVKMKEGCGKQVVDIFTEAQEALDRYLEDRKSVKTKYMYEAANRKTYGYNSTMSSKEKIEQMILNTHALDMFAFNEL